MAARHVAGVFALWSWALASRSEAALSPQSVVYHTSGVPTDWSVAGSPQTVADDATHGTTLQFAGEAAMFSATAGFPDSAAVSLLFELKMLSAPLDGTAAWHAQVHTSAGSFSWPLSAVCEGGPAPVLKAWVPFTCNLGNFFTGALGSVRTVGVHPEAGKEAGSSYLLDNVEVSAPELVVFDEAPEPLWPLWDCCSGSQPATRDEGGAYGVVAAFSVGAAAAVVGFRAEGGVSYDLTRFVARGALQFDFKLQQAPANGAARWMIKAESANATTAAEDTIQNLSDEGVSPPVGSWQRYTIPVGKLVAEGCDVGAFSTLLLFPTWDQGEGAIFYVDNVRFVPTHTPPLEVKPAFTASPFGGPKNIAIQFDASMTERPTAAGVVTTFNWDFGDSSAAFDETVSHTYMREDVFRVVLTVTSTGPGGVTVVESVVNHVKIDADRSSANGIVENRSAKRGVAFGEHSQSDLKIMGQGITWWSNWDEEPEDSVGSSSQDFKALYGAEFLPMAWNGAFDEGLITNYLQDHPGVKYVLGFNEPSFGNQANMKPSEAAAQWPRLEAIASSFGLKIVAPAVNYCGTNCVSEGGTTYTSPFDYLDDFFAACPSCKVDAIAVHAYMQDAAAVSWYVNEFYTKYNLPVWLTEFCAYEYSPATTPESQKTMLVETVDALETAPFIERYSWFIGRSMGHPYNSLLDSTISGTLTELGSIYLNMPVHGNASIHTLPKNIQAEDYATVSGASVHLSSDAFGLLHVGHTQAGSYLEYNTVVPTVSAFVTGVYDLTVRAASASGGTLTLAVDSTFAVTVTVPATGGFTTWTSVSVPGLAIAAGNRKLRVTFNAVIDVNWVDFVVSSVPVTSAPTPAPAQAIACSAEDSSHSAANVASNVCDGDAGTRWSSVFNDNEWIYVDLASVTEVASVVLNWDAHATSYTISASNDSTTWTLLEDVSGSDGGIDVLTFPSVSCRYVRMYGLTRSSSTAGFSLWSFDVFGPGLSPPSPSTTGWIATASSIEAAAFAAKFAVDGDLRTRWSSQHTADEWLYVDLGSPTTVSKIVLNFEDAHATAYDLQVSDDALAWTTVYTTSTGDGGTDTVTLASPQLTRFVKFVGKTRNTQYGYSLWEFSVF
ncbi:Alkali-sensitive linkage protein 1 [Diplonema papillatum]|nr:Alkali-sensitive linkage protein 1 [Diplonema papillatum]